MYVGRTCCRGTIIAEGDLYVANDLAGDTVELDEAVVIKILCGEEVEGIYMQAAAIEVQCFCVQC